MGARREPGSIVMGPSTYIPRSIRIPHHHHHSANLHNWHVSGFKEQVGWGARLGLHKYPAPYIFDAIIIIQPIIFWWFSVHKYIGRRPQIIIRAWHYFLLIWRQTLMWCVNCTKCASIPSLGKIFNLRCVHIEMRKWKIVQCHWSGPPPEQLLPSEVDQIGRRTNWCSMRTGTGSDSGLLILRLDVTALLCCPRLNS